ncbi:MAG TPA: MlaD family protein [Verrucomicrobiota bacterium]|nr:MlaD family protein [Verrucomicrobiota bacterium]HNU51910.1 MlaD family protein [Verrucomicrobiota bacterium]
MRNTLETRLGIFFALAIVAAVIILEMIGGMDFLRHGLHVNARFNNIQELKIGDAVKMAGKTIGRVEAIELADQQVVVRMKITDRTAVVRTDSKATVKFSGLMGQNYVAIDFGTPGGVPIDRPDQTLESYEQADVANLVTKLDSVAGDIKKITGNLTDVKLDDLVGLAVDVIKENRTNVYAILTNAHMISEKINAGQGTLGRLIADDALYQSALSTVTNLNTTAEDVQGIVEEAKAVVAGIRAGQGTLGRLTTDDRLYAEITEAATNLKEILQKVNRGDGSVGKLVNDQTLIDNAKLTLQKLDKATESLEDQGPLSVIGILVNPLF